MDPRDVVIGYEPDGTPVYEPFAVYAAARAVELQAAVRAYVDVKLPPTEREALIGHALAVILRLLAAQPVDPSILAEITAALAWVTQAQVLGEQLNATCAAAADLDALAALTVDPTVLGTPPPVSAGRIAAMLGGA